MRYIAKSIEVEASEITAVFHHPVEPDASKFGVDIAIRNGLGLTRVSPEMCARYTPVIGDYYVVQSDGYAYVNPKEVFERKYRVANDSN
jgi:hypothetical protein